MPLVSPRPLSSGVLVDDGVAHVTKGIALDRAHLHATPDDGFVPVDTETLGRGLAPPLLALDDDLVGEHGRAVEREQQVLAAPHEQDVATRNDVADGNGLLGMEDDVDHLADPLARPGAVLFAEDRQAIKGLERELHRLLSASS
jgi:hypothetical protein